MIDRRGGVVALLVLGVVVAGLAVLTPGVVAQESGSATADSGNYTLNELKQDGKHYSVTGARIVPEERRIYWLEYRPANQPWKDVKKESNAPKFGSGDTLKTNTIYLRTIRARTSSETANVTIVFWERGTREVTRGNATSTVPVAENVSVVHKSVTLGPGWSLGEIEFPQHDREVRVTMWVDEHPQKARWTFKHHSVAFTQPIDADTWSEFTLLASAFVILPALGFGAVGSKRVRRWVDTAGAPPGHGALYYSIIATIVTGLILYGLYAVAAEIIVTAPVVLGLGVGAVYIGYMLSTHEGRTQHKLFWQPHIESVEAFTSTKIPSVGAGNSDDAISFSEDMPFGKMQTLRVLDEGQNGLSVVRDGWLPFLARLKGGRARIENVDELKTRFSLVESPWDEAFIVDPDAETLADYEPPGLRLKTPDIDSWKDLVWPATVAIGSGVLVWKAAALYGPVVWATVVVVVPYLVWKYAVTGTDSYVHIDPAPAAMRPVLATMLAQHVGYRDASTLEEAEEFAWRTLSQSERESLTRERNRDDTFIDESFGGDDGDGTSDEVDRPDPMDDIDQIEVETDD